MMSSQINMEVGSEAEYSVSDRAVSTAKLETIMNKAPRHIGETSIIVFTLIPEAEPGVVVAGRGG